jgi:hypothetical protein
MMDLIDILQPGLSYLDSAVLERYFNRIMDAWALAPIAAAVLGVLGARRIRLLRARQRSS